MNTEPVKPTTKKAQKQAEIDEHKAELRKILPEGSTLRFIIRSVSSSGMSRVMTPIILVVNQKMEHPTGDIFRDYEVWPRYPGRRIAAVLGLRYIDDGNHSFRINGCGMDMCFAVANDLSYALYGKGNCIKHETL